MPSEKNAEILQTITLDRQEMIEAVLTYDDEPDESQSTEAFLAQLKELEARWKSLPPKHSGTNAGADYTPEAVNSWKLRRKRILQTQGNVRRRFSGVSLLLTAAI
jgi:hypothetical protein